MIFYCTISGHPIEESLLFWGFCGRIGVVPVLEGFLAVKTRLATPAGVPTPLGVGAADSSAVRIKLLATPAGVPTPLGVGAALVRRENKKQE